jgi:hypothetical protein
MVCPWLLGGPLGEVAVLVHLPEEVLAEGRVGLGEARLVRAAVDVVSDAEPLKVGFLPGV